MKKKTSISFLARTARLARAMTAGALALLRQSRRVAMTLLLALMTSTSAWALEGVRLEFREKSQAPIGYLDVIETYACCIHVAGWTCDPYLYTWRPWDSSNWLEYFEDYYSEHDLPDVHYTVNDNTLDDIVWWLHTLTFKYFHSATQNKVEIHLQQNGEDKYVFTYDMNKKREDAQVSILSQNNYYHTHKTGSDVIVQYDESDAWVANQLVKDVNFGFDYWINIPNPGNYTVVVYGTNTHGTQGKAQLTNGNRNISIPQWEYITYDANGGNGPVPATQRKTYIDQITLGTTIPTREGYTFMGWNTERDSEGTHYNPGDTYSAHAATLYAQWVRNSFYDSYETIRTVEDWNDLATLVNNGCNMRGQTIKLANDIGESWTIYAWNEGDEDATKLATVDNYQLNSTCTLFELNNSTAYQYFSFVPSGSGLSQMAELQFFTGHPNIDIVNPVFGGVTIKSQTAASDNIFFEGSYSTLSSTEEQMLDAHNDGGKAFHATLNLSSLNIGSYDVNCYSDAGRTTPAAGTIPFNASDGSVTLYPKWTLTLNNDDAQATENEKNTDIISSASRSPMPCDVTLAGRTLYKDGDWNTLCLPFSLGNPEAGEGHCFDGTLLEGATVKTLESTSFEDGTLTMNFVDVPVINAGVPYLVKWGAQTPNYVENPVFEGVSIRNGAYYIKTDYVDFVGTHSSTVLYEEGTAKHNLYLGTGNTLYYPTTEGYKVNACRAYFQLKNGLTAGDPASALVRAFVLNFGDGEETAIRTLTPDASPAGKDSDGWYTLDGRRLSAKPTASGIYINNGRKVVMK